MKTCDIIIPSYNSGDTLSEVLAAINTQALPSGWEVQVFVCDDGSTDHTAEVVKDFSAQLNITYIAAKHAGAAAARNRGIDASQADVLLFLGADIVLRPGALTAHLSFHDTYPNQADMALGFVVWDPALLPTPLMEWMTHGGPQNDFDALLGDQGVDPARYFYGSHVSVKRAFLGKDRFSEEYSGYGYEDIDLGRRLAGRGGALHAIPDAVGLHQHVYDVDSIGRRQRAVGRNAELFYGQSSPEGSLSGKHMFQVILYAFGFGMMLKMGVKAVAGRYSCPRLFAHYVNYEFRRGVIHSKYMSSPQPYPQ